MDTNRNVIAAYDPFKIGFKNTASSKEIELRHDLGEEIVGVYGVLGQTHWFTSFGFITKIRSS